ncbi:alpha-2,8-sialyltransferase 8B-like [Glandiceps talaboti]
MDFKKRLFLILVAVNIGIVILVAILDNRSIVGITKFKAPTAVNMFKRLPCDKCPSSMKFIKSLEEIREIVSKTFDLETSLAIYQDHVKPGNMEFEQNNHHTLFSSFSRDYYDNIFYTVKMQEDCAIVGNSGLLLNSSCGKQIDSHDFVMRMNLPTLKGYEEDVGRKTNITATNSFAVSDLYKYIHQSTNPNVTKFEKIMTNLNFLNDSIVWIAYEMTKTRRSQLAYVARETLGKRNFSYKLAYSPIPVYPKRITRFWNRTHCSEGNIMFTISTLFCKKITMYGFWPFNKDRNGRKLGHHYYDSQKLKQSGPIPTEYLISEHLERRGVINLVNDKCTPG